VRRRGTCSPENPTQRISLLNSNTTHFEEDIYKIVIHINAHRKAKYPGYMTAVFK
jgi:hypothetical protein